MAMKSTSSSPVLLACALAAFAATASADLLQDAFTTPPADAKPHTWWHWCNGNISKEGITLDLEAMRRIGVGGAQIFNVAPGAAAGTVLTGSPEWRDLTHFAITEANRVGVELAIHNCPGWSESGGPWVTAEQSMQKVVFAETQIAGPRHISEALPKPEVVHDFYKDIAVLAFPSTPWDEPAPDSTVTASVPVKPGTRLTGTAVAGSVELPFTHESPTQSVTVELSRPVRAASLSLTGRGDRIGTRCTIEAGDDGKTFRKLAPIGLNTDGSRSEAMFPEVTARFFRITAILSDKKKGKIAISHLKFSGPRLSSIDQKAAYRNAHNIDFSKDTVPAEACVPTDRVIDLTAKLGTDGTLTWDAPEGKWTVIRFGHTSTGRTNAPAPDSGRGLECDKLSRAAVESHFEGMMGKVIADAGPLAGKTLRMVLADSWEAGCQNWTAAFRDEFKKRRGYDPVPWLITLTGRAVGGVEQSERFLWDFRRTIADLVAENHYAVFQELCHKHGMLFTAEAPGIGMPTTADEIQCKSFTDVPMGEFWLHGNNDSREPACAAHVFGKQLATAEAFTASTPEAKWAKAPFDHKALGDLNFCRGINRFVFHRYAMQPWKDRFPGMTMGPWGTNFERTNTWWEQAAPWMTYVTRCQALLQTGLFSADVLYFYGEGAPVTITGREPQLPPGYDFDACDTGALFKRVSVRDGKLVLPDGMNYRLLLLPPSDRMTPAVLRRVKALAEAGATVMGAPVTSSPSLNAWPACDAEVRALAKELWGASPGTAGSQAVGKGRVVWGKPIAEILAELSLKPDFESDAEPGAVAFIHRHTADAEFYFVSSQSLYPATIACTFRVAGKIPELWHSDTGVIEDAPLFTQKVGRTVATIAFEPAGSVFVVFRKPAAGIDPAVIATRDGGPLDAELAAAKSLVIEKALYGANPETGEACADVTAQLAALAKGARLSARADNKTFGEPAQNRVKSLQVTYSTDGQRFTEKFPENAAFHLPHTVGYIPIPTAELARTASGALAVRTAVPGVYEAKTAAGKALRAEVRAIPQPLDLGGGWNLAFPPKWGAPEKVALDKLISWTEHPDDGVKHFSGTAVYSRTFDWKGEGAGVRYWLDLGSVKELAQVILNGKDLGVLWKPPFRVDATVALRPGQNVLEVRITNLWPNRMIGDSALPKEKRVTWAAFEPFTPKDALLPSGLLGPVALRAVCEVELK